MSIAKLSAPVETIARYVDDNRYTGTSIDHAALEFLGVFVLRGAFSKATLAAYTAAYFEDREGAGLKKTPFHLTEVKIDKQHRLNRIIEEPEFIAAVSSFFGGNVGRTSSGSSRRTRSTSNRSSCTRTPAIRSAASSGTPCSFH